MTAADLVRALEELGVLLWEDDGALRFRAPPGVMTDQRRQQVAELRGEVLELLRAAGHHAQHDEAGRFEPFPLTDVQASYLLGRRDVFRWGGVGCHGYGELSYPRLDAERVQAAWQRLVARHDMLRAVFDDAGFQRVLLDMTTVSVSTIDLRGASAEEVAAGRDQLRASMDHRLYDPTVWPLFEVAVSHADSDAVMHVSIDFLVADFVSIQILLDEFHLLLEQPCRELPPIGVTFRDCVVASRAAREHARSDRDRTYWWQRLDELPPPPDLPVRTHGSEPGSAQPGGATARFRRWETVLPPARWAQLKSMAARHGVSSSAAVITAFTEVIGRWSSSPRFTIDVTLLDRRPLHPDVGAVVGDFTSVSLLSVDTTSGADVAGRAGALQATLWQDLDHRLVSGVEVMRELARRRGSDAALMPVVFTSAIGTDPGARPVPAESGRLVAGISQTPQVWIDCQNIERDGALATNWDVRDGVFPPGVVDAMFSSFTALLELMTTDEGWRENEPVPLPVSQREARSAVQPAPRPLPDELLHDGFFARAYRHPDDVAVLDPPRTLRYGELAAAALAVRETVLAEGCGHGDRVVVLMEPGWQQIAALLGVLAAGGVYVPIDYAQPPARRATMIETSGAAMVLTQSWLDAAPMTARSVAVDGLIVPACGDRAASHNPVPANAVGGPVRADPDDPAYVIFTSGSTGVPKGVVVSHRGAVNTLHDITRRFAVSSTDRGLALANASFDLSVYDVFGLLAAGASLLLPPHARRTDPSCWAELAAEYGVTFWNSVPAQAQMLVDYLDATPSAPVPPLRIALLSGDWIPVTLPDRFRGLMPEMDVISLGGATEASIWSIWYPIGDVDPAWASIPYGFPLTNQTVDVLDGQLRPCPDWVTGSIHIGGAGVALGYLHDLDRTAERFVHHHVTGERLYSTGDLGRFLPDGSIELLGRDDLQVKIRGHRIELAEVEAALQTHPQVATAAVVVAGQPLERRLVAFVEPLLCRAAEADVDALTRRQVLQAAEAAGRAVLTDLDVASYRQYLRGLDNLALGNMRAVLGSLSVPLPPRCQVSESLRIAEVVVDPQHHRLLRRWLHALAQAPNGETAVTMTEIAAWGARAGQPAEVLDYFDRCAERLPALLTGQADALGLLFPGGSTRVATALYEDATFNRWANAALAAAVAELSRMAARPLQVLEVGAGTGGTTAALLSEPGLGDLHLWYTDRSGFFVGHGQQRFAAYTDITYQVFDLDRDPLTQNMRPNAFDVVVAGDVLHAVQDVATTLEWIRGLLRPGGWLVMTEMTREHYQAMTSIEFLMRLDPQSGDLSDLRRGTDRMFLDRAEWADLIAAAGGRMLAEPGLHDPLVAEAGMGVWVAEFKQKVPALDTSGLLRHVGNRLPEVMRPADVLVLDRLPLTDNGKVDRNRLRGWVDCLGEQWTAAGEEPAAGFEQHVAAIWSTVLAVPRVSRDVSFFDLRGDSLLASKVATQVKEEVAEARDLFFDEVLRVVLERPTVATFCEGVRELTEARAQCGDDPLGGAVSALTVISGGADERDPVPDAAPRAAVVVVPDLFGDLEACNAERDAVSTTLALPASFPRGLADDVLLDRLLADWAEVIAAQGVALTRLRGVGWSGLLAMELARRLLTQGIRVPVVEVVDCRPLGAADRGAVESERAGPPTPDGAWAGIARALSERRQPYAGDLQVVLRDPYTVCWPGAAEDVIAAWEAVCLGEVELVVEGDHGAQAAIP